MDNEHPLYLFAKPPAPILAELKRLRAFFGIQSSYALHRLHSTLLPLGAASRERIATARDILAGFYAEPFEVAFDHVEGATLKPRKGQRAPGNFQRALARHFAVSGCAPPAYQFSLHLNLDYAKASDRRAAIAPLRWLLDEIQLVESVPGDHIEHGRFPLRPRQYRLL